MNRAACKSLLCFLAIALCVGCACSEKPIRESTEKYVFQSADKYVFRWMEKKFDEKWQAYEVKGDKGKPLVWEWISTHQKALSNGEIAPHLSITSWPQLFRVHGDAIEQYHLLLMVAKDWSKPKAKREVVVNIPREEFEKLKAIFGVHGTRTDWIPSWERGI